MSRIRTQNEIIAGLLDFFRVAQPGLDTKPGSVARDLIIDGPSVQIARLYEEVNRVSLLQAYRTALGIDLDKLAANFDVKRRPAFKATVLALFTFNSLEADFAINKGDIVTAKNGASFSVINGTVISTVFSSNYKATASRYRSDLDFIGISDQYAVEVLCQATSPGILGNISKYGLSSTNISGVTNVTNIVAAGGGRATESDAAFKSRILAVFSGANTGTAPGYKNAVTSDSAVIDAIVITPGDSLMTRDGTQVYVAEDGTRTVISEGTGGKVDVLVYGVRLQESVDSFVYRDLSNTNDPTNSKNDFVLGQIASDAGKTVTRKRLDNLETKILPSQPVNNVTQVSGSISGSNFIEKSTDSLGRVTGNYELIRDTGAYGGSPWGFDRLHWINDRIEDFVEDKTKQTFNGQDSLSFSDVTKISKITQYILVNNENSKVLASNRSTIQLAHYPVSSVTRVFNATTGERYVVTNQNFDSTTSTNLTGKITISGKSLPAISDILQVDYTWVYSYDPYFDFDNREFSDNPRAVLDSVDWGYSNLVRRELATLTTSGSYLTATTTHPISTVLSVNVFDSQTATVVLTSERLSIVVTNTVDNVISIVRTSDKAELWSTTKKDGTWSAKTIYFPTDSPVQFNDAITVVYNGQDVYNADTQGSFNNNTITIVPSTLATAGTLVECTYIANISTLVPTTLLSALPILKTAGTNVFSTVTATGVGVQPTTHFYSGTTITKNLRMAPSNLALTIAGSISPGVITVSGTTMTGVVDVVFTVSTAGLKQDLSSALRTALTLSSIATIPTTIKIAKIDKIEKVTTTSAFEVLSVDHTYDVKGYAINDNSYVKIESVTDTSLKVTEFTLPSTSENLSHSPVVGNRLRVSFHYTNTESENVSFSKSGTLHTNKKFAIVDTIAISSGFSSGASASATLTVANLNQPATKSRYKVSYDYLAPKTNERITVTFNYDKLIGDATLAVETSRSITGDVLVKSTTPVLVDVTMKIGVTDEFATSSTIVLQNVQDTISSALNASALNTKVDASDLVNQAYSVNGVDSARITFFNKTGKTGSVLNVLAAKNEYIVANNVVIELD